MVIRLSIEIDVQGNGSAADVLVRDVEERVEGTIREAIRGYLGKRRPEEERSADVHSTHQPEQTATAVESEAARVEGGTVGARRSGGKKPSPIALSQEGQAMLRAAIEEGVCLDELVKLRLPRNNGRKELVSVATVYSYAKRWELKVVGKQGGAVEEGTALPIGKKAESGKRRAEEAGEAVTDSAVYLCATPSFLSEYCTQPGEGRAENAAGVDSTDVAEVHPAESQAKAKVAVARSAAAGERAHHPDSPAVSVSGVKRVLVLGATELGKAVAVLLREHGMMVDLWDARPPKEIHNLVKWATARMMTPYFGVPVPSGVYCLWVRCDGEPLAGGEVSPVELAEMYPECPFAERVLELCGRVVADPRLEGLDLDGMDPGDAKRALREMEGGKGPVELSRQPWHPAGGGPGNTRYFPLRIFIAMKTRLEEWMSGASCHA